MTAQSLAKEMAAVGIFPESMLNDILSAKIVITPSDIPTLELVLILDDRIYDMISPKTRRTFEVDTVADSVGDENAKF